MVNLVYYAAMFNTFTYEALSYTVQLVHGPFLLAVRNGTSAQIESGWIKKKKENCFYLILINRQIIILTKRVICLIQCKQSRVITEKVSSF